MNGMASAVGRAFSLDLRGHVRDDDQIVFVRFAGTDRSIVDLVLRKSDRQSSRHLLERDLRRHHALDDLYPAYPAHLAELGRQAG